MNNTTDARKFQTGNVILIAFSHLIHDIYGSFLASVRYFLIVAPAVTAISMSLIGLVPSYKEHIG